ncbi:hypothetical protein T261_5359 [Streptomyces lydicus]|nr:hypothetical protein T261_5359 [Streptomyces lydicus]
MCRIRRTGHPEFGRTALTWDVLRPAGARFTVIFPVRGLGRRPCARASGRTPRSGKQPLPAVPRHVSPGRILSP